jgi:hypothetical protein
MQGGGRRHSPERGTGEGGRLNRSNELKLLRVLQTLQSLCVDTSDESFLKKDGRIVVADELVEIFQSMKLDDLWTHLDSCVHHIDSPVP